MKTIGKIIILLLFLVSDYNTILAQQSYFAPIGAIWYYETQNMYSTGYIKMEVEKDTVINGFSCIKVTRKARWHDLLFDELKESPLPALFLAQINDSVIVLNNGTFYKLFDFGAEIGDTWTVIGREGLCEEDFGTVNVVDKGIEVINGTPLRYVTIQDDTYSYWGYGNTLYGNPSAAIKVVERIGPVGSYLLPEQKCLYDEAEGGPLRCYIDDELGELHLSSLYPERNCDYISEAYQSVGDDNTESALATVRTMANGLLHVEFSETLMGAKQIHIIDLMGKVIYLTETIDTMLDIDFSGMPSGVYFVTVANESGRQYTQKVVKQ